MKKLDVVVIGGGLAGLSCAVDLVDAGKHVLILEADDYLGGRTASWSDKGMRVESGLHRVLGYYQDLPGLLKHVGVRMDDIVSWDGEIEIRPPRPAVRAVFGASMTRRPFQTFASLIDNNRFMSPQDKVKFAAFTSAGRKELAAPELLDTVSVAQFAREQKLPQRLIDQVLMAFTDGIFFLTPDEQSAYVYFSLVNFALEHAPKLKIGSFLGGMTEVMINPIASYIERMGGEVIVDAPVTGLIAKSAGKWEVKTKWGKIITPEVVVATPLQAAQKLLKPQYERHAWFKPFFQLESHPAVTLQIDFDRPLLKTDRIVFTPGSRIACFAEQSRTTFRMSLGRLSVILSQPRDVIGKPTDELLDIVLTELKGLGFKPGKVLEYRKIDHPADFYQMSPGAEKKRPPQITPLRGLYLAGDYTKQPFMATMEGAVLSGHAAAQALLASGRDNSY